MLPAQVGHRHATFSLAQHGHDLGFAKSALLHQNLLEHLAAKILLLKPLIRAEDYCPRRASIIFPRKNVRAMPYPQHSDRGPRLLLLPDVRPDPSSECGGSYA